MQNLETKIEQLERKLDYLMDQGIIEKIDKFNQKVEEVKKLEEKCIEDIDWSKEPLILDAKDLKRITGLGVDIIYCWFKRKDFPNLVFGKNRYVITKKAFRKWLDEHSGEEL